MLRFVLRLIAATSLLLACVGVAPVSAGGGCHGEDGSVHSEGDATVVRMGPCSFSPTVVHVPAGTEVRFLNTAQVDHLVVGESQTWGTQFALVPGKELARTFAEKGVYPFSCPLHPGMVGAIVVGGADAAAVPPPAAAGGDSRASGQRGASRACGRCDPRRPDGARRAGRPVVGRAAGRGGSHRGGGRHRRVRMAAAIRQSHAVARGVIRVTRREPVRRG